MRWPKRLGYAMDNMFQQLGKKPDDDLRSELHRIKKALKKELGDQGIAIHGVLVEVFALNRDPERRNWTVDYKKVLELHFQGLNTEEIATAVGGKSINVKHYLNRRGLHCNPKIRTKPKRNKFRTIAAARAVWALDEGMAVNEGENFDQPQEKHL
jgi:sugar phosphate isomerase/epimerase